jgi:hypothetical protein
LFAIFLNAFHFRDLASTSAAPTFDGLGSAPPSQYNIQIFLKSTSPRKTPPFPLSSPPIRRNAAGIAPGSKKNAKNFDKNRRNFRFPLENARAKKYNNSRAVRFFPLERAVDDEALDLRSSRRSNRPTFFAFCSKRSY